MAKFNIGINGADQGAAEGREAWSGELPPTGSYSGVVKILSLAKVGSEAKNAGADKIMVGIELRKHPPQQFVIKFRRLAWGNTTDIFKFYPRWRIIRWLVQVTQTQTLRKFAIGA